MTRPSCHHFPPPAAARFFSLPSSDELSYVANAFLSTSPDVDGLFGQKNLNRLFNGAMFPLDNNQALYCGTTIGTGVSTNDGPLFFERSKPCLVVLVTKLIKVLQHL